MVCDFLSIATSNSHLFHSCKKRPISTYPINIFIYEFNLAFQVCFMGCVQMCWSAFYLLLDHFYIAHFKETFGGIWCRQAKKKQQNKTKNQQKNPHRHFFVCLLVFNFCFFEVVNSAEKRKKYKLYSL